MRLPQLQLVQVEPERIGSARYLAFDADSRFDPGWWTGLAVGSRDTRWYSAVGEDGEIVRLQIDPAATISSDYGVEGNTREMVEIVRIEVLASHRKNNYGRAAVLEAAELFTGHTLGALSLNAASHRFWARIGWSRYEAIDGLGRSPLFLAQSQR